MKVSKFLNTDLKSVDGILKSLVAIGLLGAGIAIVLKLSKKNKPQLYPLPGGGSGMNGYDASDLASRLYRVMKGVKWQEGLAVVNPWLIITDNQLKDERDRTIQELADLPNDDQFVQVTNYFNTYFAEGESLYGWINSEYGVNSDVLNAVNERFHRLRIN